MHSTPPQLDISYFPFSCRLFHRLHDETQELNTQQSYLQHSHASHLFTDVSWTLLTSYVYLEGIFRDLHHFTLDIFPNLLISLNFTFSLRLCTVLDHFGYPVPLFSGWQQAQWYSLHQTEAWLHKLRKDILDGHEPLPTIGAMLAEVSTPGPRTGPSSGSGSAPSGSATLCSHPKVAQKEPRKHVVSQHMVGSTVSIGLGRKPVVLSSPSKSKLKKGKRGRLKKDSKSAMKQVKPSEHPSTPVPDPRDLSTSAESDDNSCT